MRKRYVLLLGGLIFAFLLPIFGISPTPKASAANEDKLCVPAFTEKSGDDWETDAFTFEVISRAEIKVTYTQTGNCASPTNPTFSSRLIHNSGKEFSPFANQTLSYAPLVAFGRSALSGYYTVSAGTSGDIDESTIELHDLGVILSSPSDVSSEWRIYINRVTSTLERIFNAGEYTIGIEEDAMDGLATCGGTNSNFHLINENGDGSSVKWRCDDDSTNERGASTGGHTRNTGNFNIVYKASTDGMRLQSLLSDDEKFSFTFCEGVNIYKNNNCNGEMKIEGLTAEQAANEAGNRLVRVTGPDGNFDVVFAGGKNSAVALPSGLGGGSGATDKPSCETNNGGLAWVLCGILDIMDGIMSKLDSTIRDLLTVPNQYVDNPDLYNAWRRIRNLAYIVLIPIMLVMVISTALGFEFISTYTVKKAMPRLIAAIFFITLSFALCRFLIVLSNDIGSAIHGFITSLIPGATDISLGKLFSPDATDGAIGLTAIAAGATLGLAFVSIGILFSYAFVALMGILTGFVLLSARQFLIISLLLMGPLAILAWIFPGNDKLWKLWWGSFSKLLLLFPLIMILIASGKSFAAIVALPSNQGTIDGVATTFIKIVAYVGPYFFIPAAFKFAGGIFATVSGMANDRNKGLFDRQKKYRGQKMAKNYSEFKTGDKKFRPAAFNTLGRRVGAGMSGRFGVGETGRQALALNAQHNADEALKNNPRLQKLAFHDDGNAVMGLSGGTEAGARAAARDLFTDAAGNYDSVRGDRAIAAAKAVGFNQSNARAAMTTLAQNKARSVAVGAAGRTQIQRGINRLAGSAQEGHDLRDNFAYHASGAGRGDIGATDWNAPNASLAGFERTGLYQAANGHQNGIIGAREDVMGMIASGDHDALHNAAVHREELEAMRTNATGPARDAVEESIRILDNSPELQAYRNTQSGELEVDPTTGATRPKTTRSAIDAQRITPGHSTYDAAYAATFTAEEVAQGFTIRPETMADRARRDARAYEPPNPNRP